MHKIPGKKSSSPLNQVEIDRDKEDCLHKITVTLESSPGNIIGLYPSDCNRLDRLDLLPIVTVVSLAMFTFHKIVLHDHLNSSLEGREIRFRTIRTLVWKPDFIDTLVKCLFL